MNFREENNKEFLWLKHVKSPKNYFADEPTGNLDPEKSKARY